ncbi:S-layer homology domain-containing protein, partial [Fervidobacterium sp.]
MKKVLTLIFIAALIVIVSAAFRDVPKGHWAESYVNKLAETGIVTGFPDGTFRGDESVTRYQMSLFLYRVLDYISTQTDASLRPIISHIESLNMQLKTQIEKNAIIDSLSTQVDLLEEYANVIYDAVGTKASAEDLEELTNSVNEIIGELRQMIDDLKVALDIHDSDILKIYDTLGMLSDEIVKIQEILAEYEEVRNLVESLAVKVDMHDQDIVNIYDALAQELSPLETIIASKADKEAVEMLTNRVELLEEYTNSIYETLGTKVSYDDLELLMAELDERISYIEADMLNIKSTVETGLPALRDMLYELSASFAATEERLSSYVEVSVATAKEEVKNEIQSALDDMRVVLNMHDQDIVNIYDNLSAKADREQVDALEERLAAIEEDIVGLSEILSGLAAQIGDTDYLLRKAIENTQKDLQAKIDTKASK